jgi:RNA polymerase sigma factor for flagellar operon FliA
MMEVLTRSLSEKERRILYMYYIDNLNLREIGEQLSLTESRVCQIHGNVIKRLRDRLADDRDQFDI